MRAPACSCFKSRQKLCKWGFPLDPTLCNIVRTAYSPGTLILQQLFLYASQNHNLGLSTINLSALCMSVQ